MKLIREVKLYPNKKQEEALSQLFYFARKAYNEILEVKIETYKKQKKSVSRGELQKLFKTKYPELPATVKQIMVYRVNTAYDNFFTKRGKFPRFKSENRFRSVEARQYKTDWIIKNGKLRLWRAIGLLRIRGFVAGDNYGMGRIVRRASGWYFQYYVEVKEKKQIKKIKSDIGIDVGLKSFLTDSEKEAIKPPQFFRKSEYELRIKQRRAEKLKKGSKNKKEQNNIIGKTYEHIANQRKDWLHKVSREYADKYDMVAVEKLNIKGMVRNHILAKSIQDASWGIFNSMLSYKLKMLGKVFIQVNPKYTSQKCSECGEIVPKSLSVRTHICPYCSFVADRDYNSALNILKNARELLSARAVR